MSAPERSCAPCSATWAASKGCRTRTSALHAYLKSIAAGRDTVACEVRTLVEHPNEVFDMYGRFIGDVWVRGHHLNRWLVEEGWAFPAFYASMTHEEIRSLRRAASHAERRNLN